MSSDTVTTKPAGEMKAGERYVFFTADGWQIVTITKTERRSSELVVLHFDKVEPFYVAPWTRFLQGKD